MPRLTRLVAMTASARAPGSRKSTGAPSPVGQDADAREEEQDDDRDDDRDQDVLAATGGQAQLHPGLRERGGHGRRGQAHGRTSRSPADQLEIDVLEAAAGGPQLDDQAAGRGAPAGQRLDQGGIRDDPVEAVAAAAPVVGHGDRAATAGRRARRAGPRPRRRSAPGPAGSGAAASIPAASSAGLPLATIRPPSMTQIRSASRSTSVRSWLVSRIAAPASRRSVTIARVAARASGSIPAVGSSRIRTSGRPTSARASPSRCRSPPDSRR